MREPLDLRDDLALDELLREIHDRSGGAAPFTVDVADRVMARIVFAGPVPRSEVGLGQLGRWAAAAAAIGTAILVSAASKAPPLPDIVQGMGQTTADTAATAAKASGVLSVLAGALARTGIALIEAARTSVSTLHPGHGVLGAAVTVTALLMLGVTTYVVGRDLRTTTR